MKVDVSEQASILGGKRIAVFLQDYLDAGFDHDAFIADYRVEPDPTWYELFEWAMHHAQEDIEHISVPITDSRWQVRPNPKNPQWEMNMAAPMRIYTKDNIYHPVIRHEDDRMKYFITSMPRNPTNISTEKICRKI